MDINDVATAVEDFLFAGIETSAFAASSILYCLATNPGEQDKLASECQRILSTSGGQLTRDSLSDAKHVFACFKESLRLYPVAVGFGRELTKVKIRGLCKV